MYKFGVLALVGILMVGWSPTSFAQSERKDIHSQKQTTVTQGSSSSMSQSQTMTMYGEGSGYQQQYQYSSSFSSTTIEQNSCKIEQNNLHRIPKFCEWYPSDSGCWPCSQNKSRPINTR